MRCNKSTTVAHKASKFLFLSKFFQFWAPVKVPLPATAMLVTKFDTPILLYVSHRPCVGLSLQEDAHAPAQQYRSIHVLLTVLFCKCAKK